MTRLVILGAHGQVGGALAARVRLAGIACDAFGRAECDITHPVALKRIMGPGCFIINCPAYTAVDRAETEVEAAFRVNATGAENVAAACAEAGVPLVHLSTDYVFDGGSQKPAREDDPPRPLNVYGQSKLAGEIAVRQRLPIHVILRTSWIFSAHGQNFVRTILGLAKTQSPLRVVDDQIGGPTAADDVAKAILDIVAISSKSGFADWGTYHFSGVPPVSWCEFARAIIAHSSVVLLPIATKDFPRPALRPLHSVLTEAMCAGYPVIATGWSGNMDYMTEGNSFPVRYRLIEVEDPQRLYHRTEGLWADPDCEHAAEIFLRLSKDRELAATVGAAARKTAMERLSASQFVKPMIS